MNLSRNWAGNYRYLAAQIHRPETVEEIQEVISSTASIKALGTRHSFNDIANSPGHLISLQHFDQILALDREYQTVTVEAGVRYGELCQWLDREGFALHNLASLPHISVAGACATGTHGSGNMLKNLASVVSAMELVTANGELIHLSRQKDAEIFNGTVVSLGGLGIVTKLTLDICPAYQMQQDVYENLPLARLESHFDELTSSGYSVSLFTDWSRFNVQPGLAEAPGVGWDIAESRNRVAGGNSRHGHLHPIASLSAENCTEQLGVRGSWYERLPHFRLGFTPSSGEELQSEYILPRQYAITALQEILKLKNDIAPLLQISEIRTIAADNLWISPCYRQDSVAIHFTWIQDWEAVRQILPMLEDRLTRFHARPHWGKLFTMRADHLQSFYEKLPDFRQLVQRFDPQGKFRMLFDQYVF